MLLKDRIQTLLDITQSLVNNPVANFCYDNTAMGNADSVGIPDGVSEYDVANHQNIPVADASVLKVNTTILAKGWRSKASSITRMLMNHMIGRASFNLNKLIAQLNSFFTYLKGNIVDDNITFGFASLDGNGRVPYSQLPESAVEYEGNWNASTNTPTLVNGTGVNGQFYIVEVAGTQNFGDVTFYTAVEPEGDEDPSALGWYEYDEDTEQYVASSDTEVDFDKTYYEQHFYPGTSITFLVDDRVIYDGNVHQWKKLPSGTVKTVGGVYPDGATGNVPLGIINKNNTLNAPNSSGGLAISVESQKPDASGNIELKVGGKNATSGDFNITIAGKSFTNGNFPMTVGGGTQQANNDWRLRINNKPFSGGDITIYDTDFAVTNKGLYERQGRYYGKRWVNPRTVTYESSMATDGYHIAVVAGTVLQIGEDVSSLATVTSLGSTTINGSCRAVTYLDTDRFFLITSTYGYLFRINNSTGATTLIAQVSRTNNTANRVVLKAKSLNTNRSGNAYTLALQNSNAIYFVFDDNTVYSTTCIYSITALCSCTRTSESEFYWLFGTTNGLYYLEDASHYSTAPSLGSNSFGLITQIINPYIENPAITNGNNVWIATRAKGIWTSEFNGSGATQLIAANTPVASMYFDGTCFMAWTCSSTSYLTFYRGFYKENGTFAISPTTVSNYNVYLPFTADSASDMAGRVKIFKMPDKSYYMYVSNDSEAMLLKSFDLLTWEVCLINNRYDPDVVYIDRWEMDIRMTNISSANLIEHKGILYLCNTVCYTDYNLAKENGDVV